MRAGMHYLEPVWPGLMAVLAAALLALLLPQDMSATPALGLIAVVAAMVAMKIFTQLRSWIRTSIALGYAQLSVITVANMYSVWMMMEGLVHHQEGALPLLRGAAALWVSNVLVFASWYWRLDAGGPVARHLRKTHEDGAFLFPQMTNDRHEGWKPGFIDYLFLAFNTATAFSPTDVPVLSRWAKVLMMVQSMISLATIVLLAARAVNIL